MRSLWLGLVFLAACGARPRPAPPAPAPADTTAPTAAPPSPHGPTEGECDALFGHAIALAIAERQPPPPDADVAALRAELRGAFVADCRAGTRAYHECGLAAKSRAELEACK